tara:strand:- start:370 stop:1323 length:954 start_codon:yes stop_codon:yes gene_type:complete
MLKKLFKKSLFLIFGLCLIFFVSKDFVNNYFEIINSFNTLSVFSIVAAILLYFISHFFRVLRLVVLSSDSLISIKELTLEQFKANGVNLIIPFRLGESYRVIVFKKFFGSYFRSFSILLCERVLDITLISLILIIATYFSDIQFFFMKNIIYISITIMILLLLIYFVLDEFLLIIHKIFLEKNSNKININVVKISGSLIKIIEETKNIFNSKLASCLAITFLIWSCEILVFYTMFSHLELSKFVMIFLSLSVALSSLLPNGPAGYGGVQLAFYLVGTAVGLESLIIHSYSYNFFIFGAGIMVSGMFFLVTFFNSLKS